MVAIDEVPVVWTTAQTWDDVEAPPPNPRVVMGIDVNFDVEKRTEFTRAEKFHSAIDSASAVTLAVEKRGTGKHDRL